MTEVPDVPDDVIERLRDILGRETRQAMADGPPSMTFGEAGAIGMRAVVAHLRAHPEDAAAILGGKVETRTFAGDGKLIAPRILDLYGRMSGDVDKRRIVTPWREVTP